ncbi:immunity 21 family protein [Luteolibacter flavescens]|uniref:Immunity 21 family protein n=1 Tax=Luteolibacter flavescens TaxID=1859460 RepID=A0ABT3FLR1_9BACT|nr:immunity 21 family protein [Luteolibacter flavescens]MCW1884506.1 immunity 21 family protein [Luteolibacter flavescens]
MKTATSFGGPFILLPHRLAGEWSEALGDRPDTDQGLYGEVCKGTGTSFMSLIPFRGIEVLRISDVPHDLNWVPFHTGGLVIQCDFADSLEQLLDFVAAVAETEIWEERLEMNLDDTAIRIMDSCGFDGDGQPKIDVFLKPGKYRVEAGYAESETVGATIFRLSRLDSGE